MILYGRSPSLDLSETLGFAENMAPERVEKMLEEVIQQGERVMQTATQEQYDPATVDYSLATEWGVSSVALLRSAFGAQSVHYTAVGNALHISRADTAQRLLATLKSALTAWRKGYVFEIQGLVRADVETSLIDQAADLLDASHTRAAAVVTGAVLEQHLRAIAPSWGVSVEDANGKPRTLEPLNVELKKAGAYDGIMQKRITMIGGIRNPAAHGESFENRDADVKGMIGDVLRICGDVRAK